MVQLCTFPPGFWTCVPLKNAHATRLESSVGKKIRDNLKDRLLQKRKMEKRNMASQNFRRGTVTQGAARFASCHLALACLQVVTHLQPLLDSLYSVLVFEIRSCVKELPPSRVVRSTLKWKIWICALNLMENGSYAELCKLSNCINGYF